MKDNKKTYIPPLENIFVVVQKILYRFDNLLGILHVQIIGGHYNISCGSLELFSKDR